MTYGKHLSVTKIDCKDIRHGGAAHEIVNKDSGKAAMDQARALTMNELKRRLIARN